MYLIVGVKGEVLYKAMTLREAEYMLKRLLDNNVDAYLRYPGKE